MVAGPGTVFSISRLKTLLAALSTWVAVFAIVFLLLHLLPGSPADAMDAAAMTPENLERTRSALGLDQSLPAQFGSTVGSYLRGDLGVSFSRKRPVARVLAEALPATVLLTSTAMLLAYPLGLWLAMRLAGLRGRRRLWAGRATLVVTVIPGFWIGILLVTLLHYRLGWLPASHAASGTDASLADRLQHLILPLMTLALPAAAAIARYQAASLTPVESSDHLRMARAKGSFGWGFSWNHRLRPALTPAITLFGLDLPALVSGAAVVEVLFAWPGVGRVGIEAILANDYPLALATTLLTAAFVIFGRLLAQTVARWNDPRGRQAVR